MGEASEKGIAAHEADEARGASEAEPEELEFRGATCEDVPLIMELIRELASYENALDQVDTTDEDIERWLFDQRCGEDILAFENGVPVGQTLFFYNFSTFVGRRGIYLEDLYVRPEFRGKGYGLALMRNLARIAVDRGCGRFEWGCFNDNYNGQGFYRSQGAQPLENWTVFRFAGDSLERFAAGDYVEPTPSA